MKFRISAAIFPLLALTASCAVAAPEIDREAFAHPLPGLSEAERAKFFQGRSLFRQSWVVAPARDSEVDGLGPLYNRLACISCHPKNGRGKAPGGTGQRMQSMLVRLSVQGRGPHGGPRPHPAYGDQLNEEGIPGVTGEGRAEVSWEDGEIVTFADGESLTLRRPRYTFTELAYGALEPALFSARVGPPVYGLGLLEAVAPAELRRYAAQTKPDGVRGKVNRVWDAARGKTVDGRFGLKANAPNLRQQIAGAFIGDLGITSPLFPRENCTLSQTACRAAPSGGRPELSKKQLDAIEFYVAHLAPPPRDLSQPGVAEGRALFSQLGCASCHRPELRTAGKTKFPLLANRTFAPYTDLLVHDMGDGLADQRPDYRAGGREWRTPPLWGIGLTETINEHRYFLHDGRARGLQEAILWHGGEAQSARNRYLKLDKAERTTLLSFLEGL